MGFQLHIAKHGFDIQRCHCCMGTQILCFIHQVRFCDKSFRENAECLCFVFRFPGKSQSEKHPVFPQHLHRNDVLFFGLSKKFFGITKCSYRLHHKGNLFFLSLFFKSCQKIFKFQFFKKFVSLLGIKISQSGGLPVIINGAVYLDRSQLFAEYGHIIMIQKCILGFLWFDFLHMFPGIFHRSIF